MVLKIVSLKHKSTMSDLSNFITSEIFDDIFNVRDFNCDPHKGSFFL